LPAVFGGGIGLADQANGNWLANAPAPATTELSTPAGPSPGLPGEAASADALPRQFRGSLLAAWSVLLL
jgi:hypothetical protein